MSIHPLLVKINSFLYPFVVDLEKSEFLIRQETFGNMLSQAKAMNILDIGSYYNPINLFLDANHCPSSIVIVEPILEAQSVMIPCVGDVTKSTHVIVVPITFKYFIQVKDSLPSSDAVVCIGCDSHYGPNRRMLETTFKRPYTLYLEYPSEYVHNAPFKKMMGTGQGEKMSFLHKFQAKTNETVYTKRVMKVIEYS